MSPPEKSHIFDDFHLHSTLEHATDFLKPVVNLKNETRVTETATWDIGSMKKCQFLMTSCQTSRLERCIFDDFHNQCEKFVCTTDYEKLWEVKKPQNYRLTPLSWVLVGFRSETIGVVMIFETSVPNLNGWNNTHWTKDETWFQPGHEIENHRKNLERSRWLKHSFQSGMDETNTHNVLQKSGSS